MQPQQPPVLPQFSQTIDQEWFYGLNGQQVGPVKESLLPQLISAGAINRRTLVWTQGFSQWLPIEQTTLVQLFPRVMAQSVEWQAHPVPVTSAPQAAVSSTSIQASTKTPWYFSRATFILTFLFLTPVWTILILADRRRQSIGVKIAAGLVGLVYVWFFGTMFFGAAGVAKFAGPGTIEFGSDYTERTGDVSINTRHSEFSSGDLVAWVTHLSGPVNTTRADLIISKVSAGGGEFVIDRSTINIANPKYTILYGKFPLLILEKGQYKLRISSNETIIAEGQFTLR